MISAKLKILPSRRKICRKLPKNTFNAYPALKQLKPNPDENQAVDYRLTLKSEKIDR